LSKLVGAKRCDIQNGWFIKVGLFQWEIYTTQVNSTPKRKTLSIDLQLAAVLDSLSSLVVLWRFSVRENQETNSFERERRLVLV